MALVKQPETEQLNVYIPVMELDEVEPGSDGPPIKPPTTFDLKTPYPPEPKVENRSDVPNRLRWLLFTLLVIVVVIMAALSKH